MQELMNMNYGGQNQNRGFGGAPQPQRANNRRSRGGMGPGGFRGNSRFEHNQQSGSPQPQQNNRSVEAKPDLVENKIAVQSPANKAPVAAVPTAAPKTVSEPVQKPPVQNQAPPAQAAKPPQTQETAAAPENHNLNNSGADNRGAGQEHRGPPPNNRGPVNAGPENQNNQLNNKKRQNSFGGPGNKPAGNFGGPGNKGSGNFGGQGGNFGGQGGNFGGQGGNFGGQGNFGSQGNFGGQGKTGGGPGGPPRNQRGPRGGPDNKMGGGPQHAAREEHMLASKLKELAGPLTELVPLEQSEVKFNGRSRLYIGNLSQDITEQEIQEMFGQFGETSELFLNKEKNFAFIRMDFRANAEKAKRELDGTVRRGRSLRVRFAPHNSAVRVRNLTPFVSNELLYRAFEIFGKIERAYVKVDERGKSLSEGVVEFARKASALAALRNCTEKCFFLTSSLRPVIVENFEEPDEFDGYQEKNLPKKHPDFLRAREAGPRFSEANSFEHEYGTRWKQLHELYRQKEEALKAERSNEEDKLDAQMEFAKYEHETELLREQLRQREQDRERQKRTWEIAERAAEERREAERLSLARQEEDLASRMRVQDDELRRRQQENTLFVQAQRLNSMLDRQEQGMFDTHPQQQNMDGGYMDGGYQDIGRGYDDMVTPGQHWEGARHQDDFPNKRRRF